VTQKGRRLKLLRKYTATYGPAIASLALILGGASSLYSVYLARVDNRPLGPIFIWAGPREKIDLLAVNATVDLDNHMTIRFTVGRVPQSTYHFDVYVPFKVKFADSMTWYNGTLDESTDFPRPSIFPMKYRCYWVSLNQSIPTWSQTTVIALQLFLESVWAIEEPGKNTASFTFLGADYSEDFLNLKNRMRALGSEEVFTHVKTFTVLVDFYGWGLLPSDTYPPPAHIFSEGGETVLAWDLSFANADPVYGQTIILSVSDPHAETQRDISLFLGGLLMATGVAGGFDAVRQSLRKMQNVPRKAEY